ncbi:MAG: DUF4252 domain-containing protein [Tannerellaceae bacterium]|jgi:hypothetical protein|nr:DUF4252 domain-containing protein [Tannerellaceae bacterium]
MNIKSLLLAFSLLCSAFCTAQNNIFNKYEDMEDVTTVYISKAMLGIIPSVDGVGMNLKKLSGKLESLEIATTKNIDRVAQMRKDFSKLVSNKHEELMRIKDGKERVAFYTQKNGELLNDLLMLVDSDSSFTVIRIMGAITLKELQDIAKNVDEK